MKPAHEWMNKFKKNSLASMKWVKTSLVRIKLFLNLWQPRLGLSEDLRTTDSFMVQTCSRVLKVKV